MQLMCLGDIALADASLSELTWLPPGGVIPGDDARILFNMELPLGDKVNSQSRSRGSRFVAYPGSLQAIQQWSPGFAALATNHILDAGTEGIENTLEALKQAGFRTVGAGRTQEEITRPLFWETGEGRLAVVNWVFPETHPDWMSQPGPNCWPGLEVAQHTIQALKRDADWVLLFVHWSDELFRYPTPEDRTLARKLAHMGADVVVGHHPHVVRGMEVIGACPVFYSIGNFYFPDIPDPGRGWLLRWSPRGREGLGVRLLFRRGQSPQYSVLSFWRTRRCAVADPVRRAARTVRLASQPLRRFQDSRYSDWYAAQRARFDKWGYRLHFKFHQVGIRGVIRGAMRRLGQHSRAGS